MEETQAERRESEVRITGLEGRQTKTETLLQEISHSFAEGMRKLHDQIADLNIDLNQKIAKANQKEYNLGWFIGACALCMSIGGAVLYPINEKVNKTDIAVNSRLDRYYMEMKGLTALVTEHQIDAARINAEQQTLLTSNKEIADLQNKIATLEAAKGDSVLSERVSSADMVAKKARDILLEAGKSTFTVHDAELMKAQINREIDFLLKQSRKQ